MNRPRGFRFAAVVLLFVAMGGVVLANVSATDPSTPLALERGAQPYRSYGGASDFDRFPGGGTAGAAPPGLGACDCPFSCPKIIRPALVWITHDLSVVAGLADRVCVMYAGRIVEQGTTAQVLDTPAHPYTQGLLDSVPSRNARGARLKQIPGMTPSLAHLPPGCAFRERCPRADDACGILPLMDVATADPGRGVRCHHPLVSWR